MVDIDLKRCDLLEFASMCSSEYNKPELSDRVLVFDVMQDGWDASNVNGVSHSVTWNGSNEKQGLENPEGPQSLDCKTDTPKVGEGQDENESIQKQVSELNRFETKSNESLATQVSTESLPEWSATIGESENTDNVNEPLRQHKIYVNSFWLSVQSPYFRSLFYSSGMKENGEKEVHVKVSESEEKAHLIMLEAMYHGDVLNGETVDTLLGVLELANKYDLKFVFKKCKYVLRMYATTFKVCTKIMHMIKVKHNMEDVEDLTETLQLVLAEEFSPLDDNWNFFFFTKLSEPSIRYLLSSDNLIVQSENTVFHALMYWIEQNEVNPESLEEMNDLLAVVRFKLVTVDYLYNVIKNHPIASKMPKFNELYLSGMTYHALPEKQKKLLKQQPALRKKPEETIFQHEPYFMEEDFQIAIDKGIYKNPHRFWACGYKMSIDLIRYDFQNVRPQLCVHNLKQESLVRFRFTFTITKKNYTWHEKEFSVNSSCEEFPQTIKKGNHRICAAIVPLN